MRERERKITTGRRRGGGGEDLTRRKRRCRRRRRFKLQGKVPHTIDWLLIATLHTIIATYNILLASRTCITCTRLGHIHTHLLARVHNTMYGRVQQQTCQCFLQNALRTSYAYIFITLVCITQVFSSPPASKRQSFSTHARRTQHLHAHTHTHTRLGLYYNNLKTKTGRALAHTHSHTHNVSEKPTNAREK